jgi:hypothetical protein
MRSVMQMALKDISAYNKTLKDYCPSKSKYVGYKQLITKETRHLNKMLEINKINYIGNKNFKNNEI